MRAGPTRKRAARRRHAALVAFAAASACGLSHAEEYRRPGLEGPWNVRHLTVPMNSVNVIAGPGQPMLLGQRYGDQMVEGGPQFIHPGPDWKTSPPGNQYWLRGGIAFGLTQDWEAGALFLPFQFGPKFDFSNITVFVTRGFRFEHWDAAFRLSFQTPTKNSGGGRVWGLNPGIPLLWRLGRVRLEGAVLVPFTTRDWTIGLNVPVRAAVNVTPHVFFGLTSGFVEPRFDVKNNSNIPLGALAGYTALFGASVVDFTATFDWDKFVSPSPPESVNALDVASYRVGFGVVFHSLVR
jgi:hypothetical protein